MTNIRVIGMTAHGFSALTYLSSPVQIRTHDLMPPECELPWRGCTHPRAEPEECDE